MIEPKKPLRGLERVRHPIKSRETFETLERNERTTDFPENVLNDLKGLVTGFCLRGYPEMDALYAALSQWSGFPENQILVTAGADGGLKAVWEGYVGEGDEVVTLGPTYAMYPVYSQMQGAKAVELTYDENLNLPLEKILSAIHPNTRLVAIANPNQPIESMYTLAELETLAKKCHDCNAILIVDEAYFHFNDITAAPLIGRYDNLFVIRTFSKAFGIAGLRLGYVLSQKENIKNLAATKPIYETDAFTAAVGVYLLKHEEIMKKYVADVNAGRAHLVAFFRDFGCSLHGKHSNTLLVGLPAQWKADDVVKYAKERNYLIRAQTQAPTRNHLRITLGPEKQMAGLTAVLSEFFKKGTP